MSGYVAQPLKSLPPPSYPPEGEPHDLNTDVDLKLLPNRPYILSPSAHIIDVDVVLQPYSNVPIEELPVEVAAHFHGVSHSQGARCPYFNSVTENNASPVPGVTLARDNEIHPGNICAYARCDLLRIPLGVSCILITISSEKLSHIKSARLDLYRMRRRDRTRIATKTLTRDDIAHSLSQAKSNGGTLTIAAIAMNCGWWHIHTYTTYFRHTTASDFIRSSCLPLPAGDPTKAERFLSYLNMFKPLTRRITLHTSKAFQLPLPRKTITDRLKLKNTAEYVISRITGRYPGEEGGGQTPTLATSLRPNEHGQVDFKWGEWTADRVMASDPREMIITLLSTPDPTSDYAAAASESDEGFLGQASLNLNQVWELLQQGEAEHTCDLQLKLGPSRLPQCTGSVLVSISVKPIRPEEYTNGIRRFDGR